MRVLLVLLILGACGLKGDPLPVPSQLQTD